MNNEQELSAWLALFHLPGVGPKRFFQLLEWFGNAEAAVQGDRQLLRNAGVSDTAIRELDAYLGHAENALQQKVVKALEWHQQPGHNLLTFDDEAYPPLLKHIIHPPPLLFVDGCLKALQEPGMAMVGSRNPTADGKENAFRFARALANVGISVNSGLALGIDGAAHQGALAAGGPTIAVIGTGIDQCYPASHQALAKRLIHEGGAIVSEFSMGIGPKPGHFPKRNRTISGLSLGVLVVEANLKSGSLITAQYALEQGRDVYAIPGSIHNPMARGCHALLKQGAKLVEAVEDILEEMSHLLALHQLMRDSTPNHQNDASIQPSLFAYAGKPAMANVKNAGTASTSGDMAYGAVEHKNRVSDEVIDHDERALLNSLGFDVVPADTLVERTGLGIEQLSPALMMLEIKGLIRTVPGGYQRC